MILYNKIKLVQCHMQIGMSLFKTRDFWSTKAGDNEEYDLGCLAVGDVDNKQDGGSNIF